MKLLLIESLPVLLRINVLLALGIVLGMIFDLKKRPLVILVWFAFAATFATAVSHHFRSERDHDRFQADRVRSEIVATERMLLFFPKDLTIGETPDAKKFAADYRGFEQELVRLRAEEVRLTGKLALLEK